LRSGFFTRRKNPVLRNVSAGIPLLLEAGRNRYGHFLK